MQFSWMDGKEGTHSTNSDERAWYINFQSFGFTSCAEGSGLSGVVVFRFGGEGGKDEVDVDISKGVF